MHCHSLCPPHLNSKQSLCLAAVLCKHMGSRQAYMLVAADMMVHIMMHVHGVCTLVGMVVVAGIQLFKELQSKLRPPN